MSEVGRWLFALGLILSWTNSALHILLADRPVYAMSPRALQGKVASQRVVAVVLPSVWFLGLVAGFLTWVEPEWFAVAILVSMVILRHFEIAQWHDRIVTRLGKYVPTGACLLAWLVANVVLRLTGTPPERAQALAWNASCGMLAGAYVLAAIAKFREAGLYWIQARNHAVMFAERSFTGPRWVRSLRWFVAHSRLLTVGAGHVGIWAEVLAGAFVWAPARPFVIGAVVALHGGFMLLLGYFEPEWIVVMIAVAMMAA